MDIEIQKRPAEGNGPPSDYLHNLIIDGAYIECFHLSKDELDTLCKILVLGTTALNEEEVRLSTDNPHKFKRPC